MPEVSGYGSPAGAVLQRSDSSASSAPTKPESVQTVTERGVEVVLSSQQARSEAESYQELNRPVKNIGGPELSESEQKVLDNAEYEQRNADSVAEEPDPSQLSEREQRSLDALL